MTFHLAKFDGTGKCTAIIKSPVPFAGEWVEVPPDMAPDDIFQMPDGSVIDRELVEISLTRNVFLADGVDGPDLVGEFEFIGPQVSEVPANSTVRACGSKVSETLIFRFVDIDDFKAETIAKIDAAAGNIRLTIITDAPGQSAIYAAKLQEAHSYLNDGEGPFFYVNSRAAAEDIIARAEECNAALAAIEAMRLAAKAAVRTATDVPTILAAADVDWSITDEHS